MDKAFAYLRVSGKGQVDGDGFVRQLKAIKDYAAAHRITVVKVFREEVVSGTKELENRPALLDLIAALDSSSGVRSMMVEKLDRVARDLMVQETIIAGLRKSNHELISVAEPDLCIDDPSRKLMRQIFGSIAEYEKTMLVLKLRGARQRKRKATGTCEGRKPYGSRPGEELVIDRILALRKTRMAVDTIAETLNAEGMKSRTGGDWYGSSVRNVLLRAA